MFNAKCKKQKPRAKNFVKPREKNLVKPRAKTPCA
jgi:hypothetical protein